MRAAALLLALLASGCDGSSACNLVGNWQGSGGGTAVAVDFASDGTFALLIPQISGDVMGHWTLSGSTLMLTDDGCGAALGTYGIGFGKSCSTLALVKVNDTCTDRSTTFDGTTLER